MSLWSQELFRLAVRGPSLADCAACWPTSALRGFLEWLSTCCLFIYVQLLKFSQPTANKLCEVLTVLTELLGLDGT